MTGSLAPAGNLSILPPELIDEPTTVQPPAPISEFLGFMLGREAYALPLSSIREILQPPPITEVPRAAHHILGLISVRGRVTTVCDLRRLLRLPEAPMTRQSRVLLVDSGEETLGVFVDIVLQVYRLRDDEMELAHELGDETSEYVMGVGRPTGGRAQVRGKVAREADVVEDAMLILLDPGPLWRR